MNRDLAASRRALRAALNRRRLLELLTLAIERNLNQDAECDQCEVLAVGIKVTLRRSGDEFRARDIRVIPEYGPVRPLTAPDRAP